MNKKSEKTVYRLILAAVLVMFVLLNVFSGLITERLDLRLDTTADKLYALSGQTERTASELTDKTDIYVISTEKEFPTALREMLVRYEKLSDKLSVSYIDPFENPIFIDTYRQQGIELNESDILVTGLFGAKKIAYEDLLVYSGETFTGIDLEQQVTSAVLYVNTGVHASVVLTTGHNERISNALQSVFSDNNYEVSAKALTASAASAADIIVIASPTRDFTAEETKILADYLEAGGQVMVFFEPGMNDFKNLTDLLSDWNIALNDNVVFDAKHYVDGNPINLIPGYTNHPMNSYFTDNQYYLVCPSSRSLSVTDNSGNVKVMPVLYTAADAYAKAGSQYTGTAQEQGDETGSFMLAATAEKTVVTTSGEKTARIFAVGSRYIYADDIMSTESYANREFLAQAASYLSGGSSAVSIPVKSLVTQKIGVTESQETAAEIILIGVIPVAVLAAGIIVHFKRKKL